MNTIAALTRSNPAAAEQAVEDLADLFRASLANSGEMITLAQELEIARVYQRMEEQRLGDRLAVDWQLNELPLQVRVPGLTIQPLAGECHLPRYRAARVRRHDSHQGQRARRDGS